jgi:glycylpeptide N-tetradecanoyltransferase
MQHPKHNVLNAAYMYYYATDVGFTTEGSSTDAGAKVQLSERLNALVQDLLTMAKKVGDGKARLS